MRGGEIDLMIDRGSERIGLEFEAGVATDATDWKHLLSGIDDGVIHRGLVAYNGSRTLEPHAKISVVPATQILGNGLERGQLADKPTVPRRAATCLWLQAVCVSV